MVGRAQARCRPPVAATRRRGHGSAPVPARGRLRRAGLPGWAEPDRDGEVGTVREFSIPASVRVDDGDTLPDEVFDLADEFPDTVAVRRRIDGTWADVTYAAFVAEIVDVARGLIASGVAPGDRVALLSRPRYEWTLLDYAIGAVGAVTVPIYETSAPEQVGWILSDSGATAAVVE